MTRDWRAPSGLAELENACIDAETDRTEETVQVIPQVKRERSNSRDIKYDEPPMKRERTD